MPSVEVAAANRTSPDPDTRGQPSALITQNRLPSVSASTTKSAPTGYAQSTRLAPSDTRRRHYTYDPHHFDAPTSGARADMIDDQGHRTYETRLGRESEFVWLNPVRRQSACDVVVAEAVDNLELGAAAADLPAELVPRRV